MSNSLLKLIIVTLIVAIQPTQLLAAVCFALMPPVLPFKRPSNSYGWVVDPTLENYNPGQPLTDTTTQTVKDCVIDGIGLWNSVGAGVTVAASNGNNTRFDLKVPSDYVTPTLDARTYPYANPPRIEFPDNISYLATYKCSRIKKVATHEMGHILYLNEMGAGGPLYSVMKNWAPNPSNPSDPGGDIDLRAGLPSCGDAKGVVIAYTFEGPPDPGGPGAGCDIDAWSNSSGCCHPEVFGYASQVGHMNYKPSVHIVSPANNATYMYGSQISLAAHTMDLDGSVYRVNWVYRVVGGAWQYPPETYSYPFSYSLSGLAPGNYEIRADAYDTAQEYTISPSIFVTVAPPPTASEVLASGGILWPGQYRMSANGQYMLIYQTGGNLVEYGPASAGWPARMATMTSGNGGTYMNPSGNVEVYNSISPLILGWQSLTGTAGNAGSYIWVRNDGVISLIRPNGTQVVQW